MLKMHRHKQQGSFPSSYVLNLTPLHYTQTLVTAKEFVTILIQ